ncbi:MAG: hypothetical protein GX250_02180 [Clostridiales bacterium]|jgi:hypothetical protein|nr:hypothetical protein [Clostridiales bacterium]
MYFGSVKFFKQLIVTVFLILILLPTAFAIFTSVKCTENSKKIEEMETTIYTFSETLPEKVTAVVRRIVNDSLKAERTAFKAEVESYVSEQLEGLNEDIGYNIDGLYYSTVAQLNGFYQDLYSYIDNQTSGITEQTSATMDAQLEEFKEALQTSIGFQLDEIKQQLAKYEDPQTDGDTCDN